VQVLKKYPQCAKATRAQVAQMVDDSSGLNGHGFIRAVSAAKRAWASAPEGCRSLRQHPEPLTRVALGSTQDA
jgi:hypothetical protein